MRIVNDTFTIEAADVDLLSADAQKALRNYFGERSNVRQGLNDLLNGTVATAKSAQAERVKAKYDKLTAEDRATVDAILNGKVPDS